MQLIGHAAGRHDLTARRYRRQGRNLAFVHAIGLNIKIHQALGLWGLQMKSMKMGLNRHGK
jgi:hypothetical protein